MRIFVLGMRLVRFLLKCWLYLWIMILRLCLLCFVLIFVVRVILRFVNLFLVSIMILCVLVICRCWKSLGDFLDSIGKEKFFWIVVDLLLMIVMSGCWYCCRIEVILWLMCFSLKRMMWFCLGSFGCCSDVNFVWSKLFVRILIVLMMYSMFMFVINKFMMCIYSGIWLLFFNLLNRLL